MSRPSIEAVADRIASVQRYADERAAEPSWREATIVAVDEVTNTVTVEYEGKRFDLPASAGYLPEVGQTVRLPMSGAAPVMAPAPPGPLTSAPPEAVTGLTVAPGLSALVVRWNEVADADVRNNRGWYEVQVDTANTFATGNLKVTRTGATSTMVVGLVAGTAYYTRVRAIDQAGEAGPWSATVGPVTAATIAAVDIPDNSITTSKIVDDAINAAKIAANAVGTAELDALAVTAAKVAASAITTTKLADDAVVAAKIAAGEVTTAKLAALAVDVSKLADQAVTSSKIVAGAVTTEKLTVASLADNVLPNGDFEEASAAAATKPAGWHYAIAGAATVNLSTAQARGGAQSVAFAVPSSPTTDYGVIWSDGIPVTEGDVWVLSDWVKGSTAIAGGHYLRVLFYANPPDPSNEGSIYGGSPAQFDVISNGAYSTSWVQNLAQLAVPAGARWMLVAVYHYQPGTIGTGYVDLVRAQRATVTATIADGTITTGKLAALAVTAGKIAADTITANEIAANAIGTNELAALAVTAAKIAAGTITATEIAASTITGAKIAATTITAANIAADTITAAQIAANAITTAELNALAVTTAKIAANAVTANEIAADTITAGQIAANAITTAELNANAVTAAKIAADTITANEIAASAITTAELAANAVTAAKIAANEVSADKLNVALTLAIGQSASSVGFSDTADGTGFYLGSDKAVFNTNVTVRGRATLLPGADVLPNGNFDTDVSGWTVQVSGGSISQDTTAGNFDSGTGALKHVTDGTIAERYVESDLFAIDRASPQQVAGRVKNDLATASNRIGIRFYDAASTFISEVIGRTLTGFTAFTDISVEADPPSVTTGTLTYLPAADVLINGVGGFPADTVGNRYTNINEAALTTADFLYTGTFDTGYQARSTILSGALTGKTITNVQLSYWVSNTGTFQYFYPYLDIGGTLYFPGATQTPTSTVRNYVYDLPTNPATGLPWTAAAVEAFRVGGANSFGFNMGNAQGIDAQVRMYQMEMRVQWQTGSVPTQARVRLYSKQPTAAVRTVRWDGLSCRPMPSLDSGRVKGTVNLIAESQLDAATASVIFSNLPQTYRNLWLVIQTRGTSAALRTVEVRLNGDTGANYMWANNGGSSSTATFYSPNYAPGSDGLADGAGSSHTRIINYAGTTFHKQFIGSMTYHDTAALGMANFQTGGVWRSKMAVTSLTVLMDVGNLAAGTRIELYGE